MDPVEYNRTGLHLHVDPFCGAAGDMLLASLLDAGAPLEIVQRGLAACGLDAVTLTTQRVARGAISALCLTVDATEDPPKHRHLSDIVRLIEAGDLPARVKQRALAAFRALGEAEASIHGIPVEEVHFHEVGALDSLADIIGVCIALEALQIETVSCGTWRVGHGTTRCEHGTIPLPSPATAALSRGFILEDTGIPFELFTPTAAALLSTLSAGSGAAPAMRVVALGHGAGHREISERANICRVLTGQLAPVESAGLVKDSVILLEANLDDQSPEATAYALECLRNAGSLDVWSVAAAFKKNRHGVVISVLCREEDQAKCEQILLRETTTLGVRSRVVDRAILHREALTVMTVHGKIEVKIGRDRDGIVLNIAPEYESAASASRSCGAPLQEVMDAARVAARARLEQDG